MPTLRTMGSALYATAADGSRIAYRVQGHGPAVVFTNGFTTSSFYWRDLLAALDGRARLITWDLKGHGASGPGLSAAGATIEGCADDLRRVMDAAEVEQVTLVGFSVGCQIILEAWRHFPARIRGLIPILGACGHPFDGLIHPRVGPMMSRTLGVIRPGIARAGLWVGARATRLPGVHRLNQRLGVVGREVARETMQAFYDHMDDIDAATWLALGRSAGAHSAADVLTQIDVPALVITGGRDLFTPASAGKRMARDISGCEHVHLPNATHTGLFDESSSICDAVTGFLSRNGLIRI
ncbi:alpha/beta fold hydrolase [Haliangium sp.]|uniref:alpha/beta fold hydrolase n=1 Tax=Haliangium sp. TaxID=2663208 RepID=UPI003D0F78E9